MKQFGLKGKSGVQMQLLQVLLEMIEDIITQLLIRVTRHVIMLRSVQQVNFGAPIASLLTLARHLGESHSGIRVTARKNLVQKVRPFAPTNK